MELTKRHKIREATFDDIPEILLLCRKFAKESGTLDLIGFDRNYIKNSIEHWLVDDSKFAEVYEVDGEVVGIIAGFLFSSILAPVAQAGEVMWYVLPEYRGTKHSIQLLDDLEKWSKEKGAKILSMLSMEQTSSEGLTKLYAKRGYEKTESTYVRRL